MRHVGLNKGGHILLVSVVDNIGEGEKARRENSRERTFQLGNVDPLPK